MTKPSLNARVAPLVHNLIDNAGALRVGVSKGSLGETLIDCGVDAVTGATMSSSLIYDEIRRTNDLLKTLSEKIQ